MTEPDSITLLGGAQVHSSATEVYSFQMQLYADWLQAEHQVKIEKVATAHGCFTNPYCPL